jgi:hypothetical protein
MSAAPRVTVRRAGLPLIAAMLLAACPSHEQDSAGGKGPEREPLNLAGLIFTGLPKLPANDPPAREDGALAVAEIAVPGYAPRLRLLVAGDDDVLARGAAKALVRIRLMRENDRQATLAECTKTETNRWVREECARQMAGSPEASASPSAAEVLPALRSGGAEERRAALRRLLAGSSAPDGATQEGLVHLLKDDDLRVRLLTEAVFLKAALAGG